MDTEKHGAVHVETTARGSDDKVERIPVADSERVPEAMGREASELPKGYFYSLMFLGSYTAIGKSLLSMDMPDPTNGILNTKAPTLQQYG